MKSNKSVLLLQGGWLGHEPVETSARFAKIMEKNGYSAKIVENLEPLNDLDYLMSLDLIVMCWTQGEIERNQVNNVSEAVGTGVGLAGCHGGLCDAFRKDTHWQFMTGGQWVSHPGGSGIEYRVNVCKGSSPLVEGLEDFDVISEQYYLHVDPAVEVLATTRFPSVSYYNISNKPVDMPVAWTKFWGNGRVFYSALGHHDDVFDLFPNSQILMERGMLWAAEGKKYAIDNNLTTEPFKNEAKMY
ncbi:MAG: ThuA domain-containing protein [Christensenellales bacterium]|jgi:type 1 glutamine amidotransferase